MDDIQTMTPDERRRALQRLDRLSEAGDWHREQQDREEQAAYASRIDAEHALEVLRARSRQPGWSAQDQAALQAAYARLGPLVPEPRSDSGVRITIGQTDLLQGQTLRRED